MGVSAEADRAAGLRPQPATQSSQSSIANAFEWIITVWHPVIAGGALGAALGAWPVSGFLIVYAGYAATLALARIEAHLRRSMSCKAKQSSASTFVLEYLAASADAQWRAVNAKGIDAPKGGETANAGSTRKGKSPARKGSPKSRNHPGDIQP